ncbi:beta-L-arabinofuranosidase domain-containing protein [Aestuariibaculum marinum]|uniref:Glycoside hydrolase family 127 protein n=1 Tax=Aestuariibaculum marinum TaxID=2683592 RepID=A0A8J6PUD8_9FLAO|nr:beta-L-arabinofuranosidase domain-containing protein [Aestuariibaculum marinum]MBD0823171.1 glycoside hydrolase family 127 protein [Aestuariibaculum marinum]
MKNLVLPIFAIGIFISFCKSGQNTTEELNAQSHYGELSTLPFGAIKPIGWIHDQIQRDLEIGILGHFDEYGETVTHNLFVSKNRESTKKYGGLKGWWSGEHEGYWKDAVLRSAYLVDDPEFKKRAAQWMNDILKSTDDSGYIGIYAKNNRFQHTGENGELWTQSRILLPMIAYYEITDNATILEAVEKSVQLTMTAYKDKTPWVKGEGGVAHGVGYFEILEWLYAKTGKEGYADFSKRLYDELDDHEIRDDDLIQSNLLDPEKKFTKHGAHVAEGFLIPEYIFEITKKDTMKRAAKLAMDKLNYASTPSGAMVCDENVRGLKGSANGHYEYCTTTEFINPLGIVLSLNGNLSIADRIEKMVFNALQGARLPNLKALAYLSLDNRTHMDPTAHGARETYDACHDAAACCTLNGGRVMPYYIQHSWKVDADDNTLLAVLYGPNALNTEIAGTKISILEKTEYPFSDLINFEMKLEKSTPFSLVLRKPFGCKKIDIKGISPKDIQDKGDRLVIYRTWEPESEFSVQFNFDVLEKKDNGNYYFQRGALVYAKSFTFESDTLRTFKNLDFHQLTMKVTDSTGFNYKLPSNSNFTFETTENVNFDFPFDKPLVKLVGTMVDESGANKEVELIPVGNTVMRKVSFSKLP